MKKRGISLIVLIITIIVVIILAAVVILTLSKTNPIESAKEARFKEDVRTFQSELAIAVSKEYANAGGHRDEKITTSDFEKIKEYIPSFSEKYNNKFLIEDDELKYTNVTDQEKEWCDSLYIKNRILYKELEYIESTGEQYIDTGLMWKARSQKIEGEVLLVNYQENGGMNISPCLKEGNLYYGLAIKNSNSITNVRFHNGELYVDFNYSSSLNVKYYYVIDKKDVYIDNVKIASIEGNTSDSLNNMYEFASNRDDTVSIFQNKKLFYLKIYENNKIIRDYIPVLDQNNKPALYDKVEGKFYYSQGTGEDFKYKLKE